MSAGMGWTSAVVLALASRKCASKWTVYIDVEQDGTGVYGVQVIDVSDYVLNVGKIERSTMACDRDWNVTPNVTTVDNGTAYFTRNLMVGHTAKIPNIWSTRPSGEADARDCRLYIDLTLTPETGTAETKRMFEGKILSVNPMENGAEASCEIESRSFLLDPLDTVLKIGDGGNHAWGTAEHAAPTDPYRLPDPYWQSIATENIQIDGIAYSIKAQAKYVTIFSQWSSDGDHDGIEIFPQRFYFPFLPAQPDHLSFIGRPANGITDVHLYPNFGTFDMGWSYLRNPVTYIRQTPPHIIYAVAHYSCGIADGDIDVASFNSAHTWAAGNNLLRSIAFMGAPVLDLIKSMCECSWQTFIYVNGSGQLACDYLNHAPGASPTWNIYDDDFIRIVRYGENRDRKVPGVVKFGWHSEHQTMGDPSFGIYFHDCSSSFVAKELTLEQPYDAKSLDNFPDDLGGYEDYSDYVYLEIELGPLAFLVDLTEAVGAHLGLLGLGIDAKPDNFRIHKIVLDPETMTGIVTLIKNKAWNAA